MCSYAYGIFLSKFQPECSKSTCSFMQIFTVVVYFSFVIFVLNEFVLLKKTLYLPLGILLIRKFFLVIVFSSSFGRL